MRSMYSLAVLVIVAALSNKTAFAETSCVKAATFNAALSQMVPEYENRKERLADELRAVDADFMCLNGIWLESDMKDLVEKLESDGPGRFNHHWSPIHDCENTIRQERQQNNILSRWFRNGKIRRWVRGNRMKRWLQRILNLSSTVNRETSCSEEEKNFIENYVMDCAEAAGCLSLESQKSIAECIAVQCRELFRNESIGTHCIECLTLFYNPHLGDFSELNACLENDANPYNVLNPSGLMIISKHPIHNTRYVPFFEGKDLVLERGFIEAEINGFKVACTQLSSNRPEYLEYDEAFEKSTYEEQNGREIEILMDSISFKCEEHMILGDLGTGPFQFSSTDTTKFLAGQWPTNFVKFPLRDYYFPYLYGYNAQCTSCSDIPLHGVSDNNILNHILMNTRRFGDQQPKTERILDDVTGGPLSNSYGQLVDFCFPDDPPPPTPEEICPPADGN